MTTPLDYLLPYAPEFLRDPAIPDALFVVGWDEPRQITVIYAVIANLVIGVNDLLLWQAAQRISATIDESLDVFYVLAFVNSADGGDGYFQSQWDQDVRLTAAEYAELVARAGQ